MDKVEGWKLVPVELSPGMRTAAEQEMERCSIQNYGGTPTYDDLWDLLLDAAPTPPAQENGPIGDWLWIKFMDLCKARGVHPSDNNDLFVIIKEARERFESPAQEAEPVAVVENDYLAVSVITRINKDVRLGIGTKLYTHPTNDELKRAARELIESFEEGRTIAIELQNLRTALGKK